MDSSDGIISIAVTVCVVAVCAMISILFVTCHRYGESTETTTVTRSIYGAKPTPTPAPAVQL